MIEAANNCKLRITCTVTGDARLNATSTPNFDESPNSRSIPLFLDLSDRYHKRSRQTTGDYASVLTGDADEADDESDLQAYIADVLENELSADIDCEFKLHGIHTQYEIGDLVASVDGRDIFLNRNKPNPSTKVPRKYVQIVGIRWMVNEQQTELMVENVDDEQA